MTPDEARALVESIRGALGDLAAMIREAYEGEAWRALGYDSWALMCQHEFSGVPQLPSGERRPVVAELTAAGMSQHAIGQALDTPRETIRNDQRLGHLGQVKVRGLDGRMITPRRSVEDVIRDDPAAAARIDRARLRARWSRALAGVSDMPLLDPEQLAGVLDPNELSIATGVIADALTVINSAAAAQSAGLRIVKGTGS